MGKLLFSCGILLMAVHTLVAQDFSSFVTSMPQMKSVFSKLCADTPEFSAKAVIGLFDKQGTLRKTFPTSLALTGDCMRQEFDVWEMSLFPPEQRASMKLAHLDKIVIITRIDKKEVYAVFPGVEAYSEFSIPDSVLNEIGVRTNALTIQKTELGQETVSSHFCKKIKVTVSEPNRPTEEAILWCAADLQQFPVKLEIYAKNGITKIDFQDVQIKRPDAALFQVPANYIMFSSVKPIMDYAKDKLQGNSIPK